MTIRNLPADVAEELEHERRRRGESLNKTVIDLLRRALGLGAGEPHDNGLGRFAGTWDEDDLAEFERNTALFEEVDPELWS
jgi:hypothetical protein